MNGDGMLDRLDRKVDMLLDRTRNVEHDHNEILKLRERMHAVEGFQRMVGNVLEDLKGMKGMFQEMDQRLETVERHQVTAEAVNKALEDHQERVTLKTERREKRIFATLGLLASMGVLNFLINLLQNSP